MSYDSFVPISCSFSLEERDELETVGGKKGGESLTMKFAKFILNLNKMT